MEQVLRLVFLAAGLLIQQAGIVGALIIACIPFLIGLYLQAKSRALQPARSNILQFSILCFVSFSMAGVIFIAAIVLGQWG